MKSEKFFHLGLTFLLTAVFLLSSACGKRVENSDAALKASVDTALNSGDWNSAFHYAKMAVKADKNNIEAQVMYAICQNNLGNFDESVKMLKDIVQAYPDNFLAQLSLGEILFKSEKYEEAYENLSNAYKLENNSIDAIALYAQCSGKLQTKNTPELYAKLAQTKEFSDKIETYNNLGVYYTDVKNYSDALRSFLKAYKIDKNNPTVVANLGIFRDECMNDVPQSRYFYRKFITLTIDNSAFDSQREYFSKRLRELRN